MKCLNCGKEIPEGRKFCSRSCSATYNNKVRERKPWTEEQKNSIRTRVEQVCKYCGKPTGRSVWKYAQIGTCLECRPFVQHLPVFTKLGYTEGPLKDREDKAFNLLYNTYYIQNQGIVDIVKRYGIRRVSLLSIFRANGIKNLRTKSEGVHTAWQVGKLEPIGCSKYKRGKHVSWEGKEFRYRSSYELDYALYLDAAKIPYEYEPKAYRTEYFDTQKQKVRTAIPDFYLPQTNEIVEIKSSFTLNSQEMQDKKKAYVARGLNFKLILNMQEVEF